MLCAIIGMVFLFQSEAHFVNKNKYIYDLDFTYDNLSAYIYGILTIICWSLANALLQKNRAYVHHTVDTFYVGFFTTIVVPALLNKYEFTSSPHRKGCLKSQLQLRTSLQRSWTWY